jgi:ribonuclease P protein component
MLSSDHRLRHEKDIAKVLKSRAGAFDNACGVKMVRNGLTVSRFTVVVGTKVSKKAVDRNRIRRQYREILRAIMATMKPGFDVILLTAKPALTLDYQQKEAKLRSTLHRAKLL